MATKIQSFISTKEAGKEIGRDARSIQRYINDGMLKASRFGRFFMIDRKDWEDFKKRMIINQAS